MPADIGIVYPLWNHTDGGDSLLERVAGEVGIDHVTIPVITGARTIFRFFGPIETPYFRTEGGWHFPPNQPLYAASGIKPRTARWMGQRDDLARVVDAARGLGIRVIFRLDVSAPEGLGAKAIEYAPRNAWGDAYESAPPCISNPQIRELVQATLGDLMRYAPDGFEVVNPALDTIFPELVMSLLESPFGPGLELCFCAACRQIAAAEVDAEQAARSVRAHNSRFASTFKPGMGTEELAERFQTDKVLAEYVFSRVRSAESWLSSLAARYPDKTIFTGPIGATPSSIAFNEIEGVRRLSAFAPMDDDDADETDEAISASAGGDEDDETRQTPAPTDALVVPLWWSWRSGPDRLVRAISGMVEHGFTYLDISEIDQTPQGTIDWLRQAVRYARRG